MFEAGSSTAGSAFRRKSSNRGTCSISIKSRYTRISLLLLQRVSMDNAPGVLIADQRVQRIVPVPRLKLLIDWEPRGRVFWRNLTDLILARQNPPVRVTSRPSPVLARRFRACGCSVVLVRRGAVMPASTRYSVYLGPIANLGACESGFRGGFISEMITYYPPTSYRAAESRASEQRGRITGQACVSASGGAAASKAGNAGAKASPCHAP